MCAKGIDHRHIFWLEVIGRTVMMLWKIPLDNHKKLISSLRKKNFFEVDIPFYIITTSSIYWIGKKTFKNYCITSVKK